MITSELTQYGGPSRNNLLYSKPYTKPIDNMRMPAGYQPPKFQEFDRKGNPKQHVARFVETCNNAGIEGDLLVKQFARSLKGNAFDWYTNIEPELIDCWEAIKCEFLNWFYSTRRSVSMMELTNTRQWKDEHVVDYINRWRSLSLDCKESLSEISAVEMCMQGMHWGLLYILQGNRPACYKELATWAHDMEISIANHGGNSPALPDPRKERREGKKVERSSSTTGKESSAVTSTPLKQQPLLKELEGKVYPFPDFDVLGILNFLLEKGIIELSKSKHPEESGQVNEARLGDFEDFPDEEVFLVEAFQPWMMFLDGAVRSDGVGAGVVFVSPQRKVLPYSFTLREKCSNNVAEYRALIIGIQMALELGIPSLAISGYSKLVINQLLKEYEVKKEDFVSYFCYATILINKFDTVELEHVPREENRMADALANLATTLALRGEDKEQMKLLKPWSKLIRDRNPRGFDARLCLEELEALDEKRLEAQQRLECYQARLLMAFNKRVRPRNFTIGDLVLAVLRPIITTYRTGNKFTSKWDGPYVIKEVYTNGSYKIIFFYPLLFNPKLKSPFSLHLGLSHGMPHENTTVSTSKKAAERWLYGSGDV
ncbi:hypothetical protein RJ639_031533 [Escallonia herrerae]|uniref:RNase H type-1 domain-containing protein n=1 Tax=Escallonia herrerae TaxID=1293975 RepID=A0AA88X1V9_9ASTE|nr:hypothetical protein RJ639_031533 [Escallonia herrerae]